MDNSFFGAHKEAGLRGGKTIGSKEAYTAEGYRSLFINKVGNKRTKKDRPPVDNRLPESPVAEKIRKGA